MLRHFVLWASLAFLFSCSTSLTDSVSTDALPASTGGIGELLLVLDTNHLKMELGDELKKMLLEPYPGLPQMELPFDITRIHYAAFGNLFQKHKTVLFAVPFADGKSAGYMEEVLGKETVDQIVSSKRSIVVRDNVFSKGQQIIFLFGNTQQDIAETLHNHSAQILQLMEKKENERVLEKLFSAGERKDLEEQLRKELGFFVRIPANYKLVKGEKDFTWLRLSIEEVDYNVILSQRPYVAESQFDSTYVAEWRQALGLNVYGSDTTYTKVVQELFPVQTVIIPEPIYIREDRGLWKLTSNIVGGPFVSRVRVGNSGKQIYYIEGFVIAPGKDKREYMRELEVIISTFQG